MDSVANLLDRPKQYYNIDGVGELGIGFMCLCFSLLMWLQIHTPQTAIWHRVYTVLIYVFLMSGIIKYGSEAIKRRITYPRTGFVEYRKRDSVWRPMLLSAPIAALVAAGVAVAARRHWEMTAPWALYGLAFSAVYAYRFARSVRWKWAVAGIMACGALVIAFLPTDHIGGPLIGAFAASMTLFGAALLVSGGLSLRLYVRHTQPPSPEGQ